MKYPKEDWLQYQINQLKKKISDIGSGGSVPSGDVVTGIKGDNETTYRKGKVNITPENIGAYSTEEVDVKHKLMNDAIEESKSVADEAKSVAESFSSEISSHTQRLDNLEEDVKQIELNKKDISSQGLRIDSLEQTVADDKSDLQSQIDGVSDDISHLQNQIDHLPTNESKLELISLIERIGEFRELIIYIPYSDALLNEINNGKVHFQLYKQSKKKVTDMRNAYIKWVSPTENIGFGSEHFKKSFGESYTVAEGGISIPPSIPVGEDSHYLLDMAYNTNFIRLSYNLSDLSKAMCFYKNDYSVIPAEWDDSLGQNLYTDTVIQGSNVIGKRFRNNRVALRYKFRLFFETTQTYSEFTDTITIVYTKYQDMDYISIGMQIN